MKLKTLKDLDLQFEGTPQGEIAEKEYIKAEAIKWVKEDIDQIMLWEKEARVHALFINDRWMKRLNITEEDLK